MPKVPLGLPTGSNQTRFGYGGAARLVNCYSEDAGPEARSTTIYATEGLDPWLTVSASGGIKCLITTDTRLYGVAGKQVFTVDINEVVTILLTLAVEAPCYMVRNRRNPNTQVGLVTNGLYYVIDGVTITLNADPDLLGPPSSIAVRDGIFLIPTNFNRYFGTGEDDAANVAAGFFGRAQRNPDEILRVMASETDVVLFGSQSIEWHQNQPNALAAFPFVPIAQVEIGIIGPEAVAKLDRAMVWVANDGTVRMMQGYGGVRISNYSVERAIGGLLDPSVIQLFGWNQKDTGHAFMAVTCAKFTWVYDFKTEKWHERESYGLTRWRASQTVEWQGQVLAGDYATGTLYSLTGSVMTDNGAAIVMKVQCPPVDGQPDGIRYDELNVYFAPGVGNNGANLHGSMPKMMVDWSDDGGSTWSAQRFAQMGVAGDTQSRAKFTRLGASYYNTRTFRFSISADVTRAIYGASQRVTALS